MQLRPILDFTACLIRKRLYEVLDDQKVLDFTRSVMIQSMEILLKMYPGDFTRKDLLRHIEDLLKRFRNKSLGDTVFRVGQDLRRKLGSDDRFIGIVKLAKRLNLPYDKILKAFSYGFLFKAGDEKGHPLPSDIEFLKKWNQDRDSVLFNICELKDKSDKKASFTNSKRINLIEMWYSLEVNTGIFA
jgi:mannitol-1-phosphate 5-dehydrogenase